MYFAARDGRFRAGSASVHLHFTNSGRVSVEINAFTQRSFIFPGFSGSRVSGDGRPSSRHVDFVTLARFKGVSGPSSEGRSRGLGLQILPSSIIAEHALEGLECSRRRVGQVLHARQLLDVHRRRIISNRLTSST